MKKLVWQLLWPIVAHANGTLGRVELHVHLDGSIPPSTLLQYARRRQLVLPGIDRVPSSVDDIWKALNSTGVVWKRFDLVNEVIGGDEDTLSQIAKSFVAQQARNNITYTEVRWDPVRGSVSRLANASITVTQAVRALQRGLQAGCKEHGVEAYQLLCAMRGSPASACFDMARLVHATRSAELGGVVGMDLAGDERDFNNSMGGVEQCFAYAKKELRLNTTVHAGEMANDESGDVSSAVMIMHADRVGHGYAATHAPQVLSMLINSQVHVEACPAGHHDNLNATGVYLSRGVNFGLNTDDSAPYFDNASLPNVDELVRSRLGFTSDDVASAYRRAFAARFAPSVTRLLVTTPPPSARQPHDRWTT
jgi:adenosine deaminase